MKVSGIICQCGEYKLFSRAVHDFRYCPCEKCFVDGGFDYLRIGYDDKLPYPKIIKLNIKQTKADLYNDWSKRIDEFGIIKIKKVKKIKTNAKSKKLKNKGILIERN